MNEKNELKTKRFPEVSHLSASIDFWRINSLIPLQECINALHISLQLEKLFLTGEATSQMAKKRGGAGDGASIDIWEKR